MPLKSVNDADFEFGDGSMNARQYHAWLWAQIPEGLSEAKLQQMARTIDRLTMAFIFGAAEDLMHA